MKHTWRLIKPLPISPVKHLKTNPLLQIPEGEFFESWTRYWLSEIGVCQNCEDYSGVGNS